MNPVLLLALLGAALVAFGRSKKEAGDAPAPQRGGMGKPSSASGDAPAPQRGGMGKPSSASSARPQDIVTQGMIRTPTVVTSQARFDQAVDCDAPEDGPIVLPGASRTQELSPEVAQDAADLGLEDFSARTGDFNTVLMQALQTFRALERNEFWEPEKLRAWYIRNRPECRPGRLPSFDDLREADERLRDVISFNDSHVFLFKNPQEYTATLRDRARSWRAALILWHRAGRPTL